MENNEEWEIKKDPRLGHYVVMLWHTPCDKIEIFLTICQTIVYTDSPYQYDYNGEKRRKKILKCPTCKKVVPKSILMQIELLVPIKS